MKKVKYLGIHRWIAEGSPFVAHFDVKHSMREVIWPIDINLVEKKITRCMSQLSTLEKPPLLGRNI